MKKVCFNRLLRMLGRFPAALVCFVFGPAAGHSQNLLYVQSPDTLVLQAGARVYVQGGVVLSGEGQILLDGALVLGGGSSGGAGGSADWTDNNGLAGGVGGSGCVVLAASGAQIGGAVTVELPTLLLASSGGAFGLSASLTIRDSLLLGVGNALSLEGHELQLLNTDPASLAWQDGGWLVSETHPDAAPDYGTVSWEVNAGPSPPEYVLPLGVAGPDLSVEFTPLPGSMSFHMSTYGTGPDNLPLPGTGRYLPLPVTDLYSEDAGGDNAPWTLDRFWIIDPGENGSAVTLRYRSTEASGGVAGSEATLLAQRWVPGMGWEGPGIGSSGEPLVSTISFHAEEAGAWTLSLGASPLPVTCHGLVVTALPGAVLLQWSTESELSNRGFEVQRRGAHDAWQSLAFLEGAGTTIEPQSYRFWDSICPPSGALYRLMQVDYNGSQRAVCGLVHGRPLPDDAALKPLLWPNPTQGQFWVAAPALPASLDQGQPGEWQLYDLQGRLMGKGIARCISGPESNSSQHPGQHFDAGVSSRYHVTLPDALPAGMYQFRWGASTEQMFRVLHLPP
ncbi:MAG: hypothetical protein GC205_03680 [Bacteroidetes bacterium]|nr:hypothetical protein [Bacteroidota bacterium]